MKPERGPFRGAVGTPFALHEDRLLPADPATRGVARELYRSVAGLPIISPHGHTDPSWFADDEAFPNAAELLLKPDHYVFRMLASQGVDVRKLGVPTRDGAADADPREAWRLFARHFHLFRGTPSWLWLNHVFTEVFGIGVAFEEATADEFYEWITDALQQPEFRPRALFDRFNIELLATTEAPTDDLRHHRKIRESGWKGRVVTAYRPDNVIDADHEAFADSLSAFAEMTGEDVMDWAGYLAAHRKRRAAFMEAGATSTDHGHPTALTADLSAVEAEALFRELNAKQEDDCRAWLERLKEEVGPERLEQLRTEAELSA